MLEKMHMLAEEAGVLVFYYNLPGDILGYYSKSYPPPSILLCNRLKTNIRLWRVVFAEELGHHFSGACMKHYSDASIPAKLQIRDSIEHKALWWAVQYLIPFESFVEAINSGLILTYELAEYFDVTERFMGVTLRLYRQKNKKKLDKLLTVDLSKVKESRKR